MFSHKISFVNLYTNSHDTGTESEFSRSSALSSKESKKTVKEKGSKSEKGKGEDTIGMDEGFKKGFKPDESSFLPEIKAGIDEYNFSVPTKLGFHFNCLPFIMHAALFKDTTKCGKIKMKAQI